MRNKFTHKTLASTGSGRRGASPQTRVKACAEYSTSTTTAGEWFLPSNVEAGTINKGVAITSSENIWSSTSPFNNQARYVNLRTADYSANDGMKYNSYGVRAMRAF